MRAAVVFLVGVVGCSPLLDDSRPAERHLGGGPPHAIYGLDNPSLPWGPASLPQYDGAPWWNQWLASNGGKHFNWKSACGIAGDVELDGAVLECWLAHFPSVRDAISWQVIDSKGVASALHYAKWSLSLRSSLYVCFYYAYQWLKAGAAPGGYEGPPATLFDPPTNVLKLKPYNEANTQLTDTDALTLYLTTIAHSLALEIGGFLPWSINGYSKAELSVLFDVTRFYTAFGDHSEWDCTDFACTPQKQVWRKYTGYMVEGTDAIPASPQFGFGFLLANNMVGGTALATVLALLDWNRRNMLHWGLHVPGEAGDYVYDAQVFYDHWQYWGAVPVSRVFGMTTWVDPKSPTDTWGPGAWIAGCHGSTSVVQHVLRAVNIPAPRVDPIPNTGHAASDFSTLGLTESHGDDIYGSFASQPPFPTKALLIKEQQFHDWFEINAAVAEQNVSRQAFEVALEYLSNELLSRYCDDAANGRSHANGLVYAFFHNPPRWDYYTLAQLEAKNLWSQLAAKTSALDYCANYPPPQSL